MPFVPESLLLVAERWAKAKEAIVASRHDPDQSLEALDEHDEAELLLYVAIRDLLYRQLH